MTRHLEPVPDPFEDLLGPATDRDGGGHDDGGWHDDIQPLARRPTWWRWVAIVVVVAMIVATPAAYALYLLLR